MKLWSGHKMLILFCYTGLSQYQPWAQGITFKDLSMVTGNNALNKFNLFTVIMK